MESAAEWIEHHRRFWEGRLDALERFLDGTSDEKEEERWKQRQRTKLKVTRTFKASRQRVFRAWTEPELMMRWFVEGDGNMSVCEIDLREGGRYRLEGDMGGKRWTIWGSYLEVRPPERLVYTWTWKHDPGIGTTEGDTTVTVEFHDRGKRDRARPDARAFRLGRGARRAHAGLDELPEPSRARSRARRKVMRRILLGFPAATLLAARSRPGRLPEPRPAGRS